MATIDRPLVTAQEPGTPLTLTSAEQREWQIIKTQLWQETVKEIRANWPAVERLAQLFLPGGKFMEADIDACLVK